MQIVAGQVIASYRVLEPIGDRRGGSLWRAEDTASGREVFLEAIEATAIRAGSRAWQASLSVASTAQWTTSWKTV